MLRDDLVALLGKRLGNRTDLDASIVAEMRYVQETLLEGEGTFLPWFLLTQATTPLSTVAGNEVLALPADFLGWAEDHLPRRVSATDSVTLQKRNYTVLTEKYPNAGVPLAYAEVEGALLLRPIPDQVYSVEIRYFAQDTVLTTNIENKWLKYASDWMMAEVGAIMAGRYLLNQKLEQFFRNDAQVAKAGLLILHEARMHNLRMYSAGED